MSLGKRTIKKLWNAAGNECAHPDCDEELIDFEEDTIIAEQCHIYARNPSGPRYDPEMDGNERNSYDNLILLCRNHHQRVDESPEKFTADVLRRWKEVHESGSKDAPELSSELLNELLDAIGPAYLLAYVTKRDLEILREVIDWEPSNSYPEEIDISGQFPISVTLDEIKSLLHLVSVPYRQKRNGEPLYKQAPAFKEDEIIAASSIAAKISANAIQHRQVEENRRKKKYID